MGGDISEWSARRATRHYDERDLSHESSQSSTIFANSLNQIKSKHKKTKKETEKTKKTPRSNISTEKTNQVKSFVRKKHK